MPTWNEILSELQQVKDTDQIRRKYLTRLHQHTGRNAIVYASTFTQAKVCPPVFLSIVEEDIQGFMEVVHGLPHEPTDLILHSPGGSPEAAEGIAEYLHEQYPHLRVFVPQIAMSAATMLACSAHEIVMGKHSCLGPIDPQIFIPVSGVYEPAWAIKDQFESIIKEARKPGKEALVAMLPMYGPSLITQCDNSIKLSSDIVAKWLAKWMLSSRIKGDRARKMKARQIAKYLAKRSNFLSHGRHIRREEARKIGLEIKNLEDDQTLQDLVLSVFHATTLSFAASHAVKIIENNLGKAFIKIYAQGPRSSDPPQQSIPPLIGE
jgi:hypothetical protein